VSSGFTQDDGEAIAKKLGCIADERKGHKYYKLYVQGKLITMFGVRRASKEAGHGHLPYELHITQKQCRDLSNCPLSKDEYLELMKSKGYVVPPEPEEKASPERKAPGR
jgi:hypothetical protein